MEVAACATLPPPKKTNKQPIVYLPLLVLTHIHEVTSDNEVVWFRTMTRLVECHLKSL